MSCYLLNFNKIYGLFLEKYRLILEKSGLFFEKCRLFFEKCGLFVQRGDIFQREQLGFLYCRFSTERILFTAMRLVG